MANYTDPIGAVLMFGDDLIEKLDKIDKNFAKIEKSSNKLSESISKMAQSFDAAMNGIGNFADKPSQSLSSFDKMVSSTIGNVSTLTETINKAGSSIKAMYSQTSGNGASSQILTPINEAIEKEEKNFEFYKGYLDDLRKTYSDLGKKGSFPIIDWKDLDYLSEALDKTMEKLLSLQKARESLKALTDTRETEHYATSFDEEKKNAELKLLNDQYKRGISLLQQQAKEEDEIKKREEETARQREKEEEQRLRRFNERIKQRAAEESSAENEIMRKLKERLSIEEKIQTLELKGAKTEEEGRLLEEYKRKAAELSAEIENLSKKYQKVGDKAKSAFASQELESLVRRQKEAAQAQEKLNIEQARENPNFAIEKARQAKSIADLRYSLVLLRTALENVDISTKQGKKTAEQLTQAIKYQEGEVDRLTNKTQKLHSAHRGLIDVGGQLKGMFMSVFSLYQVTGFIKKMVQVRGEFELQHKALGAIIQDLDKADKLWSQITELAIESPFRVKELVTYTKQLAAYRIETDKIFEVTKRLADVSAGLGVDMNRLILAYGQVKAANYLRGQELRQFSEAGINILGELAKQFSEVEGVAVSTGEVFERVSKRMVKFEDVAKVFERLTDEGGIFYQMQEKQAETLQGRISNLKDSFDLMYDSIGKKNSGVMFAVIGAIKDLADSWQKWLPYAITGITTLTAKWIAMKVAMSIYNKDFLNMIASMKSGGTYLINMFSKAGRESNKLINTISQGAAGAGAWGMALAAIAVTIGVVVSAIREHNRVAREMNKIEKEGVSEGFKLETMFRKLATEATDTSKSFTEQQKALSKLKNAFGDILPAEKLELDYLKKLKGNYDSLTDSIMEYIDARTLQKKVEYIQDEYSKKLENAREKTTKNLLDYLNNKVNNLGADKSDVKNILNEIQRKIERGEINGLQQTQSALLEVMRKYFATEKFGSDNFSNLLYDFYATMSEMQGKIKEIEEEAESSSPFFGTKKFKQDREDAQKELTEFNNYLNDYVTATGEEFDKAKKKMSEFYAKYTQLGELPDVKDLNPILLDEAKTNFQIAQLTTLKTKYEGIVEITNKLDEEMSKLYSTDKQEAVKQFVLANAEAFKIGTDEMNDYVIRAGENADELIKRLQGLKKEYEENRKGYKENETHPFWYDDEQYKKEGLWIEFIDKLLTFMDRAPKENDTTGRGNDLFSKRIELIRKMNQEYEKLRQNFDEDDAAIKVTEAYTDAWKEIMKGTGLTITDFFKTKQGTADMLRELRPYTQKQIQALERAIGDEQVEIDIDLKVKNREEFKNELDNLLEGYNLWKELDKMNVPASLAKKLFDVQATSLDMIKKHIEDQKEDLTGTLGEDTVREALERINELEQQQYMENMKEYVKYLREAMNERVKIEYEALRKIDEIHAMSNVDEDTKAIMIAGVTRDKEKALQKQVWEDFKGTDGYISLFQDLDRQSTVALTHMRNELDAMRRSMSLLDPSKLKDITEQMEKLDNTLAERNPLGSLVTAVSDTFGRRSRNELEKDLMDGKQALAYINAMIDRQNIELQRYTDKGNEVAALTSAIAIKSLEEQRDAQENANEALKQGIKAWDTLQDRWTKATQYISTLSNQVYDLIDSFGLVKGESERALMDLAGSALDALGALNGMVNAFHAIAEAETAAQAAAGWIGLITMALSTAMTLITKINKYGDAQKTDFIDRLDRKVKLLQSSFESLQKTFERAYDVDELNTSSQQMLNNIQAQIAAYSKMRSAEQRKKKSDENAIDEYNEKIKDLAEQATEIQANLLTSLGGVDPDDYATQAEAFADAWLAAFNETGDGMDALNEKWEDIINNMIKRQLVTRGLSKYMEGTLNYLNTALGDSIMSNDEYAKLMDMVKRASEGMNEYMKGLVGTIGFLGTGETKLSGLQEGIQGMTEQTAEVLAAYANSLRLIQNQQLSVLQDLATRVLSSDGAVNPVLAELRRQTTFIDNINSTLQSIVERGAAGGRALRIATA